MFFAFYFNIFTYTMIQFQPDSKLPRVGEPSLLQPRMLRRMPRVEMPEQSTVPLREPTPSTLPNCAKGVRGTNQILTGGLLDFLHLDTVPMLFGTARILLMWLV